LPPRCPLRAASALINQEHPMEAYFTRRLVQLSLILDTVAVESSDAT
jgi:hypothetical protein